MVELRADPWDPGYGMGIVSTTEDTVAQVDPTVEHTQWTAPLPCPAISSPPAVAFVDGVIRADLRVVARDGSRRAPGVLGSFAAGWCFGGARGGFGGVEVGRALVCGSGIVADPVTVSIGQGSITYDAWSVAGDDDEAVAHGLLARMRELEAACARNLTDADAAIVLCDGPLTFLDPVGVPMVGIIKRLVRRYLDEPEASLLPRLEVGTRTPLFSLGDPNAGSERLAWYTRIAPQREVWHDHAGLVRGEVSAAVGIEEARRLADLVSALLPRFAGRPSDPRSPQNLTPVGGLEVHLRHRLGHPLLIHRGLTVALTRAARSGDAA